MRLKLAYLAALAFLALTFQGTLAGRPVVDFQDFR